MNPIATFGWLVGLAGAGLVGLGALLILNRTAYATAFAFAVLGLFVIIAGMAAVSVTSRQQGLGVIY